MSRTDAPTQAGLASSGSAPTPRADGSGSTQLVGYSDRSDERPSKDAGRSVQARIDASTARKFAAVAKARNMTDSELLRYAIKLMLREAATDLDKLQEQLLEGIAAARKELSTPDSD